MTTMDPADGRKFRENIPAKRRDFVRVRGNGWMVFAFNSQPIQPMQTLKSLLYALAFLAACAIVLGALALCFLHLFIGGAL